ncbi:hypothetical protein EON79_12845 [bacterium]|nr:MAG: hypothetical protein EON79_12845 [bacterium]
MGSRVKDAMKALALLPLAVLVVPARAQDLNLGPALNIGTLGVTLSQNAVTRSISKGGPTSTKRGSRSGGSAVPSASLLFKTSPAVRKRVVENFVKAATRSDPSTAPALRQTFAKSDPVNYMGGQLRKAGLNPASVADGMAVYLVQAWHATRGAVAKNPAEFRAVSRQIGQVLLETPGIARAKNETKQEIGESLMLYGGLFEDGVLAAKADPAQMTQLKSAVVKITRDTFGFDVAKLRLGANGFY